jgi:hypothetical protein
MAYITGIQPNPTNITNLRLVTNSALLGLTNSRNAIEMLYAEGGESFCNYVDWLGFSQDPDLIVLSSKHHYYYEPGEMGNIKIVINVKELNKIKPIKPFLHSCLQFLPEKSNFIGCFIDNEKINGYELRTISDSYAFNKMNDDDLENGIVSRFPFINMIYSLIDSKTNRYMSTKNVTLLLKEFDFKVMDMTEYNGFTFFHSQKFQDYH